MLLGGRILSLHPVASLKNMTINQCAPGCGLGRPGEGAVARRSIGKIDNIRCVGGWWDCLHFSTGRSKLNNPPNLNRGKHDNQTKYDWVWAETAVWLRFIRGFWSNFLAGGLTHSLTWWHATTYPPPAYAYRWQRGHASCMRYCASFHRRHRAG